MSVQWIDAYEINKGIPWNAVFAGDDCDGAPIYIGRSLYKGESCTAKVIPKKNIAYISLGGKEIPLTECDVLTGQGLTWEACKDGKIPLGTIKCGHTANGEIVYIGRTKKYGSLTPGKVIQSHRCIYFPFGGIEHKALEYEVLVNKVEWKNISSENKQVKVYKNLNESVPFNKIEWKCSSSNDNLPEGAHKAGRSSDGSPIYIGRASHEGIQHVAKVIPSKKIAYISHNGMEISKHSYEVLCNGSVHWIPYSSSNGIPKNAVSVGAYVTNEESYIGRSFHKNGTVVGKLLHSKKKLYVPLNGSEEELTSQIEVLCEIKTK